MNTAKFYWAIVGDASPEPVAVVVENGKRMAYTCGCQDPFEIGQGIELIGVNSDTPDGPLKKPPTPAARKAEREAWERKLAADQKRGIIHKHRRFSP